MYKFNIRGSIKKELLAELINEFMEPSEYSFSCDEDVFEIESEDINEAKKIVFNLLAKAGLKPPSWGILTGVRPVKLYGELSERCKNANKAGIPARQETDRGQNRWFGRGPGRCGRRR